jgi:hypothetical protein
MNNEEMPDHFQFTLPVHLTVVLRAQNEFPEGITSRDLGTLVQCETDLHLS